MPYIQKSERKKFDLHLDRLIEVLSASDPFNIDGNLNYIITKILKAIYTPRYFNFNRAIGVLESCKLEFYRRAVAPYEDKKIEEHGDV